MLPIVLLVVPLGLQVFESRLLSPLQPQRPEAPGATMSSGATVAAVSLEPVPTVSPVPIPTGSLDPVLPVRAAGSRAASTADPRPQAPRLRAVPRPASAHVAIG